MNANPNGGWSEGRLVNAAKHLPAVEIDCSGWEADIPADQWSEGRLENAAKALPAVVVDCSEWDRDPAVWLEVTVSFADDADVAALVALSKRLVEALQATAPDLGLVYDERLSRVAGEDVVIALTPTTNPAAVEERLAGLIRTVGEVLRQPALRPARVSAEVRRAA